MPKLLIESNPTSFTLTESTGADGRKRTIARGEFGRVGIPTANGRNYPEHLIEREIGRLAEDLGNRRVLGELDHPQDGKTSLKRVSHVITSLKIKDGVVVGEAEILDTPEGKTLKALIEANVQVGVSSRGYGSTRPGTTKEEGEVVQDDFVLKTYDFVADPAVKSAIPGIFSEDVDVETPDPAEMFLAEFPEVARKIQEDAREAASGDVTDAIRDEIRAELSETVQKQIADAIVEAREEIRDELREMYESDPEVGGAKAILAAVAEMVGAYHQTPDEKAVVDAVKAAELSVAEAKAEAEQAQEDALQAECIAYVEREIGAHPMAESVRRLLCKDRFESVDDAKEKLEAIMEDLPEVPERMTTEDEEALREDNAELQNRVSSLQERVAALSAKLEKAVDVGMKADSELEEVRSRVQEAEERAKEAEAKRILAEEELELSSYKYEKVAGLSNGRKLLSLMEGITSRKAVDRLVSDQGMRDVSDAELRAMRQKLQRGVGERQEITEESHNGELPDLPGNEGEDMDHILRLAGLKL